MFTASTARSPALLALLPFISISCGPITEQNDAAAPQAFVGQASLQFSEAEVQAHQAGLSTIMATAQGCLQTDLDRQQSFFRAHGISAFYGDRSAFARLSTAQKREHLRGMGVSPSLLSELQPTSCVGLALKCLGKGFQAAAQQETWDKISGFVRANDQDGTSLQHALQQVGWKIVYWNPNTGRNAAWDAQEKAADPANTKRFWGYHAYRWATVSGPQHNYFWNQVDNWTALVNFGTEVPETFRRIPFFIGTAHTGYHVFPGAFGQVIEGHSMRALNDPQTIESSEFNPLKSGGGPRGAYRTGLVAVPPGYGF